MTRPAAKGKTLWPALMAAAALLLTAPQAFASRTASTRPELLASPALEPPAVAQALAPAYVPQSFALHLDADRHPAAFALFPDLTPPPASAAGEKLASGVASWELAPNLQRIQIFVTDTRWRRDFLGPVDSPNLYQAFGLDPQNNTDPMGLSSVCDWYKVNGGTPPPECPVGPMVPLAQKAAAPPFQMPAVGAADSIKPLRRPLPGRSIRGTKFHDPISFVEYTGRELKKAAEGALLVNEAAEFLDVATGSDSTPAEKLLARTGFGLVVAHDALLLGSLRSGSRAAEVDVSAAGPGSAVHKAARWQQYQARGGQWTYERWSHVYEQNMVRAARANAAADVYHQTLGWGRREVTVEVEGVSRRLDIADELTLRGREVKTGYQTATQENLWEIQRDEILRTKGWDIEWHFEGTASQPLLDALDAARIPYSGV